MPLLPNEPRLVDKTVQQALTNQFLMPSVCELTALFLGLRQALDTELSQVNVMKQGKAYPIGQCLEISQAVSQRLPYLDPSTLKPDAAHGLLALRSFIRHGGEVRQVWGDLRGEYFQNALMVGGLYVDVANDTVDPRKPPVEVLPFAEARLTPIRDYHHFSRVAMSYWQARLYPNHLVPALAPYFPLVSITAYGLVQFQSACNYMIALTEEGSFYPSEAVLEGAAMDSNLFSFMHGRLAAFSNLLAAEPIAGQTAALAICDSYRDQGVAGSAQQRDNAVRTVLQLNAELARFRVEVRDRVSESSNA